MKAAKRKSILLLLIASAFVFCAPTFASSNPFEFLENRVELKTDSVQNRVEQPHLTSITASSYYDPFREVASGSPLAPKGTPRPRTNKVQAVEGAGPHTGFKRNPQTGEITGHTTFDENGFITQRTDITGNSHGGVATPHTHVHGPPNVAPDGRVFPGNEIQFRPALPNEIPGSGGS